jgi:hypothetical protein
MAGPNVTRSTLLRDGLAKVGRFEGAMSTGIAIYDRPGKSWGGDFIRAMRWHLSCKCWKIVDRTFRPGH